MFKHKFMFLRSRGKITSSDQFELKKQTAKNNQYAQYQESSHSSKCPNG